jgi:microcystin synthetase protein McyE
MVGEHLPSSNAVPFPTSEAQRQLWLSAELDRDASASYNVTTSLELLGSLDAYIFEKTINQVINRHEAFANRNYRTRRITGKLSMKLTLN